MDPVEDKLHVEIAKKCAMEYCKKSGLQLDRETMPKPTLIVERTTRGYTVTPTEYRLTYLK